MDVGVDFARVELVGQEARPGEHQPDGHPYLAVKLVHVLKVLADVFPKRLLRVQGILAAAVAIHAFQAGAAILAIDVSGSGFMTDVTQAGQFDAAPDALFTFVQPLAEAVEE